MYVELDDVADLDSASGRFSHTQSTSDVEEGRRIGSADRQEESQIGTDVEFPCCTNFTQALGMLAVGIASIIVLHGALHGGQMKLGVMRWVSMASVFGCIVIVVFILAIISEKLRSGTFERATYLTAAFNFIMIIMAYSAISSNQRAMMSSWANKGEQEQQQFADSVDVTITMETAGRVLSYANLLMAHDLGILLFMLCTLLASFTLSVIVLTELESDRQWRLRSSNYAQSLVQSFAGQISFAGFI